MNVNDLQKKIVGIVESNGGSAEYSVLVDSVEYPERQKVFSAIRDLKNRGLVNRKVAIDKETGESTLTIEMVV